MIPPFTVVLNDIQPGSVFDASATLNFGGDASITLCTLVGICVLEVVEEDAGVMTAILGSVLTRDGGEDGVAGDGGAEGRDLGEIAPAAGEEGDFFSTGEGGFLVDSSGNVTFSLQAPKPGRGLGSNTCGVVISCPATGGEPPGQSGDAPGLGG